jgi:UDP:flavonoid glycosyltransferase YjiC (YdhE family)
MRVLAATTAGAGHFAGLLPFARACARAGHDVRVAAPASFAAAVEGAGLPHEPVDDVDPATLGAVFGRIPQLTRREANALVVSEVFGRLDRDAALPGMRRLMDDWRPDVVLREPAELASYVAAEERGVPHVQTNIGLGAMDDHLVPLVSGPLEEIGCSAEGLLTAPRWTVLPPSFDRAASSATGPMTAVREPASGRPPAGPLPSWWSGNDDRPLVYVTFGSVAAGMGLFPGLYRRVLEQLAEVPARVLLTLGEAGDPAALGTLPPRVHVERWWPQAEVLPRAAAVVGHGGFGTTRAALAAGVPQVVLPLFSFDQFLNAERVAAVGVGLSVADDDPEQRGAGEIFPAGPEATDDLAEAVRAVLSREDVAGRARELAAEIDALPDVDACVASLPELVRP